MRFEDWLDFPPESERKLVLVLKSYLDGSVSPKGVISVAGFVTRATKWTSINSEWRKARAKARLESFRMADFMAQPPAAIHPYADWKPKQREAVISRLIDLMVTRIGNAGFGVAAAFKLEDYEALPAADKDVCGDNPFALCAMHVFGMAIKTLEDQNISEPIAYVFDAGDDGQPQFLKAMTEVTTHFPEFADKLHILSVTAVDKKKVPAIDTADFLAWQSAQHVQYMDEPFAKTYMRRVISKVYVANRFLSGTELMWDKDFTPYQRKLLAMLFGGTVRE